MTSSLANSKLAMGLFGVALAAAALPAMSRDAMAQPGGGPRHGAHARLFQQADADRDGRVSEAEALNFLSARFAEADANKDGALERSEVRDHLRAQRQGQGQNQGGERRPVPERVRNAMEGRMDTMFRAADADRDGRVTMQEVRPIAVALFRAADANADGALEVSELRGRRHHQHRRGADAPAPGAQPSPQAPR